MSTNFFKKFKPTFYQFGNEQSYTVFQNLTQYIDIVDQIRDKDAFFDDYTVLPNERPDQVSFKLYDTTDYYWTFFMMNDHVRESGWPIPAPELEAYAREAYPHRTIVTKDDIGTEPFDFPVGKQVRGSVSGTIGNIIKRNLSMGQLVIDTDNAVESVQRTLDLDVSTNGNVEISLSDERETFHSSSLWVIRKDGEIVDPSSYEIDVDVHLDSFKVSNLQFSIGSEFEIDVMIYIANPSDSQFVNGEQIYYVDQDTGITIAAEIFGQGAQWYAVHHYENADGDPVDVWPFTQEVPAGALAVTNFDMLERRNEELKKIKVLKPDVVKSVSKEFFELMNG